MASVNKQTLPGLQTVIMRHVDYSNVGLVNMISRQTDGRLVVAYKAMPIKFPTFYLSQLLY